ncbi:MAG: SAF domain-containing protein, partial [Planctomycetota bacterium]
MTSPERATHVLLHPEDNVVVASQHLNAGSEIRVLENSVALTDPVQIGHKIAFLPVAAKEPVRKYGQIIGFATRDIAAGEHVHVHNLSADGFSRDYDFATDVRSVEPETPETFQGYLRADGRAGTRNYVAIV